MIKKLPKEIFGEIYRQVPRLCVEVIIDTPKCIVLTKCMIPPCVDMWHFQAEEFRSFKNNIK